LKYFPALGHENGAHNEEADHVKRASQRFKGLSFSGVLFLLFHGDAILTDSLQVNNNITRQRAGKNLKDTCLLPCLLTF
jgi:hypothetical protein